MDMCVPCGDGILNIRAGAIIMQDDKLLMVSNPRVNYLYSVGGRIQMGETAEEAVIREVYEETGVKLEVDRLGFVHENYFYGDSPSNLGKRIYEISFFFYMKLPADFHPVSSGITGEGDRESLRWVTLEENVKMYPDFFETELRNPSAVVKHFITDERSK